MTFLFNKTSYPSISSSTGIHLCTTHHRHHHLSLTILHFIIFKALKIMKVFDVNGDGAMQFEEFRGIHILLLIMIVMLVILEMIMIMMIMMFTLSPFVYVILIICSNACFDDFNFNFCIYYLVILFPS